MGISRLVRVLSNVLYEKSRLMGLQLGEKVTRSMDGNGEGGTGMVTSLLCSWQTIGTR